MDGVLGVADSSDDFGNNISSKKKDGQNEHSSEGKTEHGSKDMRDHDRKRRRYEPGNYERQILHEASIPQKGV